MDRYIKQTMMTGLAVLMIFSAGAGIASAAIIAGIVNPPIENCQVNVWKWDDWYGWTQLGLDFTDSAGYYEVAGLPNTDGLLVEVIPPAGSGYMGQLYNGKYYLNEADYVSTVSGDWYNINFALEKAYGNKIEGQVKNSWGSGVAYLYVNAYSEKLGGGYTTTSDMNGAYEFYNLKPADDYVIRIWYETEGTSGYIYHKSATESVLCANQATKLSVPEGTSLINKDIIYVLPPRGISGKITTSSGTPIAGAGIEIWSLSAYSYGYGFSSSDANGNYTIGNLIPSDDYIIAASAPGYLLQYYNGKSDQYSADLMDLMCGDATVNFTLSKGPVIKGIVYIGNTSNPAPAGIWVNAWSASTYMGAGTQTTAGGYYEIAVDPSITDYVISIWEANYLPAYYKDNTTTVQLMEEATRVGASETNRNLILTTGFTIKGIIAEKGIPVSNVDVTAWSASTGAYSAKTQASITNDANYTITGLPPGTYTVSLYRNDYLIQTKEVTISNTDVILNFAMDMNRSISGMVSGLAAGQTAWITAWSAYGGFSKGTQITGTGSNVTYEITDLIPASDYIVDFYAEGYPYQVYNNQYDWYFGDWVDVSAGNQTNINFTMPVLKTISGTISNAKAGEKLWIEAYSPSTGSWNSTEVTATGTTVTYSISSLIPATDYIVYVYSNTFKNQYYNGVVNEADATRINTTDSVPDTNVNFTLSLGNTITGKVVNEKGAPVSGMIVEAWSAGTGSWGYATTVSDGSFTIGGLESALDFMVYITSDCGMFYYNATNTTTNEALATLISSTAPPNNLIITISQGETLFGSVYDVKGNPLEGIWISAWSKKLNTGSSAYTDGSGAYRMGLPKGQDYEVFAWPAWNSPYMPQKITNVSTGVRTDFILKSQQVYTLSGIVKAANGTPIPNVVVEVWSDSLYELGYGYGWTTTDTLGKYQIKGLPAANDYELKAWPPETTDFASKSESIAISQDTTRDIVLGAAGKLTGKVTDGITPLKDVKITAESASTQCVGQAVTDKNGNYEIPNLAAASDYKVTARIQGYFEQSVSNKSPGATVNFTLQPSGFIKGKAVDKGTAKPIAGILIEARSVTANSGGTALTNEKGEYLINNLKDAADYVVTAYSADYSLERVTGKSVPAPSNAPSVDFQLTKGNANTEISGIVKDINGSPIVGGVVRLDLYEENETGFNKSLILKLDAGQFKVTGLNANKQYRLKFIAFIDADDKPDRTQWAAQDGSGVNNAASAGYFKPGAATYVNFRFTSTLKSVRTESEPVLGPVTNLHSTTHVPAAIAVNGITLRAIPQPTRTPSAEVSNNPNITVEWEPSAPGADESYYRLFTDTPLADHTITKRNAPPEAPSKTRSATSDNLSGDDVRYYFYVAPVDNRGAIGDTTRLEFRIDTVSPRNVKVDAKSTESASNMVVLELGATGATQVYISNISFGEGGKWENYTTTKQWKPSTEGDKVYVQFRDLAGNTSNTVAILTSSELQYAINALKVVIGLSPDIAGIQKNGPIGLDEAIYHIQKAAGLRQ